MTGPTCAPQFYIFSGFNKFASFARVIYSERDIYENCNTTCPSKLASLYTLYSPKYNLLRAKQPSFDMGKNCDIFPSNEVRLDFVHLM